METYDPQAIEAKWQRVWADERAFFVSNPKPGEAQPKEKAYVLEMLPYPSGDLHMGHVLNYTLGDVITHYRRRSGYSVLRPMGYDAFGLPAENAAIKQGGHPRATTEQSISNIRRQMQRLGWAIDWDRELSTHVPEYYRWTQWLFLKLLEAGLAYRKQAAVKWCPNDQTVLANEQVVDGRCERCGAVVESKKLEQWFFKTTAYADRLLDEIDDVEYWPDRVIAIQRNWIGRSEGAEIIFRIEELDIDVPVFTTRADTLFGGTFAVFAPEHDLVPKLVQDTAYEEEVLDYVRRTAAASTLERMDPEKEKTGVFTGRYATNPATGEPIPIWVSDYVLLEYGTGAIMAVPAHDERDFAFAQRFDLPVTQVVAPADEEASGGEAEGAFVAHSENERLVNSGQFSGMSAPEGGRAIVEWLESRHSARFAVAFRLRDWGFSRQRYWGAPIPVVYCDECGIVPVPEEDLPVLLPEVEDFSPRGKPPLATNEEWVRVPCPRCGGGGRREVETMDTFVDSSWYFLRYCDPHNDGAPFERRLVDYWLPVDQYIGGAEHATMHLLYARFFVKVLNDLGLVGFREPFMRLFNQGSVNFRGARMSKSRGNVVPPDETVARYGADALRLYILFMGPVDQDKEWQDTGIEGMVRFLNRLWRLVHEVAAGGEGADAGADERSLVRKAHETIARVSDDIGRRFVFNTPIAALMELVNELGKGASTPGARFAAETAVSLIQPYAPHIAEELWSTLGHERLWEQPWPVADESQLARETFELVIQVNGKVRDRVEASVDEPEEQLVERALASPRVQAQLDGKEVRQTIVVPGRLVNLVV
jgi:leucyl-tRNA synthetase